MKHGGLEFRSNRKFQERYWRIERIGWVCMALLLIAALAGLTGAGGPLSRGHVQAGDARMDYPRISRWAMADEMTVTFENSRAGEVEFLLPEGFLKVYSIEAITPQPVAMKAVAHGQLFRVALGGGTGRKTVKLSLRATAPAWLHKDRIWIGGTASEPFSFIILP